MREYGRIVHGLIDNAVNEPNDEKRNRMVKGIIEMMGQLNPHLRNIEDYRHKLWDHLFLISDFKLKADSPYPLPSREELMKRPDPMEYPKYDVRFKHYGRNILTLIEKAKATQDPEKRAAMTEVIANYMKIIHANWNKEVVSDEMIKSDLNLISGGTLQLPENSQLNKTFVPRPQNQNNQFRRPKNKRPGGGQGGGFNNPNRRKFNKNNNNGKNNNLG